jgi:hypothetical protein
MNIVVIIIQLETATSIATAPPMTRRINPIEIENTSSKTMFFILKV